MNYKLLIQFDGTDFHGWQIQGKLRTVQAELEKVFTRLNGDSEYIHVNGSGRTDAGVHAEGFVANVQLQKEFTPERLLLAVNGNLSNDLRVIAVAEAEPHFHARFSAKGKTYLYRVVNKKTFSPFWVRYALHESRQLDVNKMNQAATQFIGKHDWTAFSAARSEVKDRIRTIKNFTIEEKHYNATNTDMIEFRITGDGFLRYMVRSIVGTLLEVGRGVKDSATIQTAIESGNRKLAGKTAAAHGLTLLSVEYD